MASNLALARQWAPAGARVRAMVKANAYGHGVGELIEVFAEHADELGVATLDEGLAVRSCLPREMPVFLVSGAKNWGSGGYLDAVRRADLVPAISSLEELRLLLDRLGNTGPFRVELKFDTGMGRLGIRETDLPEVSAVIGASRTLQVVGLMTHFASSDEEDLAPTREQEICFRRMLSGLPDEVVHKAAIHSCNSGALLQRALACKSHQLSTAADDASYPAVFSRLGVLDVLQSTPPRPKARRPAWPRRLVALVTKPGEICRLGHTDIGSGTTVVRPGVMLYGAAPSRWLHETPAGGRLTAVGSWATRVIEIKTMAPGDSVGYGGTWKVDGDHPVRVAVLAVGYADGYRRSLGNRSRVLIRGGSFRVIGRVSMDLLSVLVDDRIRVGDEAVLLGSQQGELGSDTISAWELAELCDTIPYEIWTSLSERVDRVLVAD